MAIKKYTNFEQIDVNVDNLHPSFVNNPFVQFVKSLEILFITVGILV